MRWFPAAKDDFTGITNFVSRYEYLSVSLSSRIYTEKGFIWPERAHFHILKRSGRFLGTVYQNAFGLVLPLLDPDLECSGSSIPLRGLQLKRRKIHTIIGTQNSVEAFAELLPRHRRIVDYLLMTRPLDNGPVSPVEWWAELDPKIPSGRLLRGRARDASPLFPLQEGYEKEEVLLNPDHFNAQKSLKSFRRNLEEQITYYYTVEGLPVAKASTNAMGYRWCQLGGVYTLPEFRCRGIGRIVVGKLLRELDRLGYRSVLFVKTENAAAINLYEKLGFQVCRPYRIVYAV
jgi:hypothetical protein